MAAYLVATRKMKAYDEEQSEEEAERKAKKDRRKG